MIPGGCFGWHGGSPRCVRWSHILERKECTPTAVQNEVGLPYKHKKTGPLEATLKSGPARNVAEFRVSASRNPQEIAAFGAKGVVGSGRHAGFPLGAQKTLKQAQASARGYLAPVFSVRAANKGLMLDAAFSGVTLVDRSDPCFSPWCARLIWNTRSSRYVLSWTLPKLLPLYLV